jgi:hypothetical protein
MTLYDTFQAIDSSALGTSIKESLWLFPAIEAVHLLALALLGGSLLMLDLRLLGTGLVAQPAARLERSARPWLIAAVVTLIVTGTLIGSSEALKLYDKDAFWVKMTALALALIFTFAIKIPLVQRGVMGWQARALAIASLTLWLSVAMAGRWIGFS